MLIHCNKGKVFITNQKTNKLKYEVEAFQQSHDRIMHFILHSAYKKITVYYPFYAYTYIIIIASDGLFNWMFKKAPKLEPYIHF